MLGYSFNLCCMAFVYVCVAKCNSVQRVSLKCIVLTFFFFSSSLFFRRLRVCHIRRELFRGLIEANNQSKCTQNYPIPDSSMFGLALAAGSLHQCIVLTLVLELGGGKEEAGEMAAGAGAPSAGRMSE